MAVEAQVLEAPLTYVEVEYTPRAQVNRWGAPIWQADAPVEVSRARRIEDDVMPLGTWWLAFAFSGRNA